MNQINQSMQQPQDPNYKRWGFLCLDKKGKSFCLLLRSTIYHIIYLSHHLVELIDIELLESRQGNNNHHFWDNPLQGYAERGCVASERGGPRLLATPSSKLLVAMTTRSLFSLFVVVIVFMYLYAGLF